MASRNTRTWHLVPNLWPDHLQSVFIRLALGTVTPIPCTFDLETLTFIPLCSNDVPNPCPVPWYFIAEWSAVLKNDAAATLPPATPQPLSFSPLSSFRYSPSPLSPALPAARG